MTNIIFLSAITTVTKSHPLWGGEMILLRRRFDNLNQHNDWMHFSCHNLSEERDLIHARMSTFEKMTGKSGLFVMLYK